VKRYYPHVMATVAVFIALGGGAYAVSVANRAKLADNALRLGGIPAHSYRQDFFSGENTATVKLRPGQRTTLIRGRLFNSGRRGAGFVSVSNVSLVNPGPDPVEATFLLLLNGHQEPGPFVTTINPGASLSVPTVFALDPKCKKCTLLDLGNNDVQLVGEVSNKGELVVDNGSMFALRPIVIPPGRSSCCDSAG
jgi:hypothetical protein